MASTTEKSTCAMRRSTPGTTISKARRTNTSKTRLLILRIRPGAITTLRRAWWGMMKRDGRRLGRSKKVLRLAHEIYATIILLVTLPLYVGGKDRCRERSTTSRRHWRCDTSRVCCTGWRSPTPSRSGFAGPHTFRVRTTPGSEGGSGSREKEGFLDWNDDEAARTVPGRKRNGLPLPSSGDGGD
jgi:hypothetical protein